LGGEKKERKFPVRDDIPNKKPQGGQKKGKKGAGPKIGRPRLRKTDRALN